MAITDASTIISTTLPLEAVSVYSKIAELCAMPRMVFDDPHWVEMKGEFKAEATQNVYWTVYTNLTPSVEALAETTDKLGVGFNEFQVTFTVNEYGNHVDWTQKAAAFSYFDPSMEQKVRSILGPNMGDSRDALCRNAWMAGLAAYKRVGYGAGATARAAIPATAYLTPALAESVSDKLSEDNFVQNPRVTCLAHRRAIRAIRESNTWHEAQLYAGAQSIINGSVGTWDNVSFIEAPRAVLPNAGAAVFTAALAASAAMGATAVSVSTAAAATMSAHCATAVGGAEVTLGLTSGLDDTAEQVRISSVNTTTGVVALATLGGLKNDHASGEVMTEGLDIYPCFFFVEGSQPMGRGDVISPLIDIGPVTDTFKRIRKLFWYWLGGYGLIRPWYSYCIEVAAPALLV